ncbi:MAG: monoamine oxidase [Alphaproteobacteria bacterium]|jgi:monoamine oxidase
MQGTEVSIIGGGIAGLYAANQLKARNIKYQLFDSKPTFGGRIAGIPSVSNSVDEEPQFYDLGPAWIFPHHLLMQELIRHMGLSLFPQYTNGDVLYQFENIKESRRISTAQAEPLYRIQNGAYALIKALLKNIDTQNINAKHKVTRVTKDRDGWRVSAVLDKIETHTFCQHVIFTLPPRIIARDFCDASWMNNILEQQLKQSQTWMSAQAKVIVTYPKPFWREKGLSGQAFSQVGPIVEIHDACCSDVEGFALFGFIGIPATQRLHESQKELKKACIKQLAAIYGHDAYRFEKCFVKDWAKDKDICTGQDQSEGSRHPQINMQTCESALLGENLYLAGSEFAIAEAGYLEGALIAVNTALKKLESRL